MTEDRELARARGLARLLDHYLVDPILGLLIPGFGDVLGSLLGFYIVLVAARRRVSPVVIARMVMNLVLDSLLGVVPIFGDAADFKFKANERNVALLVDRASAGGRAKLRDWALVGGAIAAWLTVSGLVIYGCIRLVDAIAEGVR